MIIKYHLGGGRSEKEMQPVIRESRCIAHAHETSSLKGMVGKRANLGNVENERICNTKSKRKCM